MKKIKTISHGVKRVKKELLNTLTVECVPSVYHMESNTLPDDASFITYNFSF